MTGEVGRDPRLARTEAGLDYLGRNGGRISEAEANALWRRIMLAEDFKLRAGDGVEYLSPAEWKARDLPPGWMAAQQGGTIVFNTTDPPTRLSLLHETAHMTRDAGEGPDSHGRPWQERAARLYGRYLSPEAEAYFRREMGLEGKARRRHRARASLRPAWCGRAR